MYSHETFMNFVFPPHLVTVIKARVRIQAARLPLYKEDHMKTGWLLIITRKTGLIIIKKNTRLTSICCIQHHIIISYPVPAELRLPGVPIRVDMVGTNHNKVLTLWRHMPMGQFRVNIFLIQLTSTYFWASEVGVLKVDYFDFFMKKIEKIVWIRC